MPVQYCESQLLVQHEWKELAAHGEGMICEI